MSISDFFRCFHHPKCPLGQETCNILNVSERKVRNLQSGGRIGFVRYGKKCKYKADDVYAIVMKGGVGNE